MGDFNSHIHGYCWEKESDYGGKKLIHLINMYNLKVHNEKQDWTCVRHIKGSNNETNLISCTLIDWTVTNKELEAKNCRTISKNDWLSDHIPVLIEVKLCK